jgi:hypothetical protein
MSIHPFLTNLEDEISVKGVGFVIPKFVNHDNGDNALICFVSIQLRIQLNM